MPRKSNDIDLVPKDQRPITRRKRQPPNSEPMPQFEPLKIPNKIGYSKLSPSITNAYNIFTVFFTTEIFQTLADSTNKNAKLILSRQDHSTLKKPRPWVDTTVDEMRAFVAFWIYMGIYKMPRIDQYWGKGDRRKSSRIRPTSEYVQNQMSLIRWQQINRFFHISAPVDGKEKVFDKVCPLDDHLRLTSRKLWETGRDLSIDEAIQGFSGRASETVNLPCKPTPKGFKIWVLAENGYILDWMYHSRGSKANDGPYQLDKYWQRPKNGAFSPTQSLVLQLLEKKDPSTGVRFLDALKHVIYLDNLFTSPQLFMTLRQMGIGACGTVKTGKTPREEILEREAVKEKHQSISTTDITRSPRRPRTIPAKEPFDGFLMSLRTQYEDVIKLGDKWGRLSSDKGVLEISWRDNRTVLIMTTVHDGKSQVTMHIVLECYCQLKNLKRNFRGYSKPKTASACKRQPPSPRPSTCFWHGVS